MTAPPASLENDRPAAWWRAPGRLLPDPRALLPSRDDYTGLRRSWRGDILAGVTVGVVALPLALAFGITAGLGAEAGLLTAIVAGLIAAIFGGSDIQVSGPTGAMTVVLVPIVARSGPDAVLVVGILAGIMVLLAGLFRLGRYLAYIPWPVIEGFTLGIAVIIFLQQVPAALGVASPGTESTLLNALEALAMAPVEGSVAALGVTFLVAVLMVGVARVDRRVPGSLVAVLVATVIAVGAGLRISTIGALPGALPMPRVPAVSLDQMSLLLSAALAVALLAALESLLSARVADGMSDGRRHQPDRELVGQGLANVGASLFGGMPATGAIARTAVNVRAGARTRVSAITHAVFLLVVVLFLAEPVGHIPLAALAGVLMVTAARMVDLPNVRAVLRSTRGDALVLIVTAATTILFDLLLAVEVGIAFAAVMALRAVARSSVVEAEEVLGDEAVVAGTSELGPDGEQELLRQRILAFRLDGALFFGAAQRFLSEMTAVTDVRVVILRMPDLQVLDATGAQALGEIIEDLEARHVTVLIKGPRAEHLRVMRVVGALEKLRHEHHLFASLDDAVAHARVHAALAHGESHPDRS